MPQHNSGRRNGMALDAGTALERSVLRSHRNYLSLFFFSDTATTELYTLSLHDALPISTTWARSARRGATPSHQWPCAAMECSRSTGGSPARPHSCRRSVSPPASMLRGVPQLRVEIGRAHV